MEKQIEEKLNKKIAALEEEIVSLKKKLDGEKIKVKNEKTRFFRLESFVRTHSSDKSYVVYLRDELRIAEELLEANQIVIETYQKHFAKYGTFYQDWEEKNKVK